MEALSDADFDAMMSQGRDDLATRGIAGATFIAVAACGLVVQVWRDTIEPFHYLFDDAEMSHMSIVATRDVIPLITDDHVDVPGIATVLKDGRRQLLPGRSAANLFGRHWRWVRTEVGRRLDERGFHPVSLACWGTMVAHDWWGNPRYDELVVALGTDLPEDIPGWHGTRGDLEQTLLHHPWDVPLDTWGWCLKRGMAWDYRPDAWEAKLSPLGASPDPTV